MPPTLPTVPIPDAYVKVRLSYIVTFVGLLLSLGIAVGGYRAGYVTQGEQIKEARQDLALLRQDVAQMHVDMAQLSQSLDDLKNTLISNQGQTVTLLTKRQTPPVNVTVNPPAQKK